MAPIKHSVLIVLKCENTSRRFQPEEGLNSGLLSDGENFADGSFAALPGIKSAHCLAAGCPTLLNLNLPPHLLTRDTNRYITQANHSFAAPESSVDIYPNFYIDLASLLHKIGKDTRCH